MPRSASESPAQRVGEPAHEAVLVTTQFRRPDPKHNPATVLFERSARFGAIGEYDLVQQLGRSMYVGHHRVTKQAFAIRLLDPVPPGRPELVQRQLAAARALASIDHPNVARTIEVGLHDGRVYLVMEHLRGKTLASALELHGAPSSAQAIRIGMHVARGLEAAHLRGITHRNLDADSVIVVPSERGKSTIKLVDFEIEPGDDFVRIARHSMSPELCRGGAIDHRSDLYSLGVLLHHVCTLKYPFEGSPIEIMAMYRFRSVARPTPALAGVPAALAATIQRCLREEPAERYRTAGEVLEALRHAAEGQGRRDRPEAQDRAWLTEPSGPAASDRGGVAAPLALDVDSAPTEQRGSAESEPVPVPIPPAPAPAPTPAPARASAWASTLASAPASAWAPTLASAPAPAAAPTLAAGPRSRQSLPGMGFPPAPQGSPPPSAQSLQAGVPEPVDAAAETSGVLVAPNGPRRVVTAMPLESVSARRPAPSPRLPWKPIAVLFVAIAAGSVLSLWTTRDDEPAPAASSVAVEAEPPGAAAPAPAAPAPAAPAPAAPAPAAPAAAAPPAATLPTATLPTATLPTATLPAPPSCPPGAPVLVPDVVLSVGAVASEPTGGARVSEVGEVRDDQPRKQRRKSKSRKAKPAADDDRPEEQRPRAEDPPVSGETIVVPEEEPRRRPRRHGIDRIDL